MRQFARNLLAVPPLALAIATVTPVAVGAQTAVIAAVAPQAAPDAPAATTSSLLPAGTFATCGNQIIDARGDPVRIEAINWFGAEYNAAPNGLDVRTLDSVIGAMRAAGFNTIRVPFSNQGLTTTVAATVVAANPALRGLTGLQILDAIVGAAQSAGLKVILDHHRSTLGGGPNQNGLWYDPAYTVPASGARKAHPQTSQDWVASWTALALRYGAGSGYAGTVIGADLNNEPFAATWGDDGPTDWRAAATEAGDAILDVDPHWLIFVEGTYAYTDALPQEYGMDLRQAGTLPVKLRLASRVVYSVHFYPVSVAGNGGRAAPAQLDTLFGYLHAQATAPVFVGEIGVHTDGSDAAWLASTIAYLNAPGGVAPAYGEQAMSWGYWAWDETPLALAADHATPSHALLAALAPLFTYTAQR